MLRSVRLFGALVLMLAASCWGALAEDFTFPPVVGGLSGDYFRDQCQPGDWLVGLRGEAAKDLNQVAALCQHFQGTRAAGDTYQLTVRGRHAEENGTDSGRRCNNGDVVIGLEVDVSRVQLVHRFKVICSTPSGASTYKLKWSSVTGGQGGDSTTRTCEGQSTAVGIVGGAGALVDYIGLVCSATGSPVALVDVPAAPPAPAAPPPVVKTPAPVKPPLVVNNGNGGNGGNDHSFARARVNGGGGGGASATTDTTIYDQPGGNDVAYLQSGDPVTIVNCGADNWCQISKPVDGWVWADDLKH